jgi:hypothetical protein
LVLLGRAVVLVVGTGHIGAVVSVLGGIVVRIGLEGIHSALEAGGKGSLLGLESVSEAVLVAALYMVVEVVAERKTF